MPRTSAPSLQSTFATGLITEATGLNFPENACTEIYDCEIQLDGSIKRRLGFDFEASYATKTLDRTNSAVATYLWRNVSGDGGVNIVVTQVANKLYFYRTSSSATISSGAVSTTVTLTPVSGAPATGAVEAQFTAGNGLLFVTHPYCDPFYVTYDATTDTATATTITVQIRDFEGVSDGLNISNRPTSLSDNHYYNLLNQGWTSSSVYTSTTNLSTSIGSMAFTIASGQTISAGEQMYATTQLSSIAWALGTVTSYVGTTLTLNSTSTSGPAGPYAAWYISRQPPRIQNFKTNLDTYPSNCDIWWLFKDSSGFFRPDTTAGKLDVDGSTRAPNGHFILTLSNQNRNSVSGLATITATTTGSQRPSTCAFFSGRVFYAGINYTGFNSKIYFSQIVENSDQYGKCFQVNDPTSESKFDLLPSDGGVISIPDAGFIYKLVAVPNGLAVFAANGVWYITGSTGIGFTANDYTATKISSISTLSASSFVDVQGAPVWWNVESIYTLTFDQGTPQVQSATNQKIKTYYRSIPLNSKKYARGAYHYVNNTVQWLFKSEDTTQVTNVYEFDSVLVFNLALGCFFVWRLPEDHDVQINGIVVADSISGTVTVDSVIDGSGNNVVDGSGNSIISFSSTTVASNAKFDKYFVSYASGGSYVFTWAELSNADYIDWYQKDTTGTDYESTFTTGYQIKAKGLTKFQENWVRLFSKVSAENAKYYFQSIWAYATSPSTGRWSTQQLINHDVGNYSIVNNRLKIRGSGEAVQFKVTSISGEPFHIIGWSTLDTGNQIP